MTTIGLGPAIAPGAASDMGELTGTIRQLPTHRKLVSQVERIRLYTTLPLDAIIVPASRPARNLEQAITLARATGSALLILCSRHVQPAEVQQLLAERSFDGAIVIKLPDGYRHELLDFPALASIERDLPEACFSYSTDLSTKRNVALILARMLGWRRIFFLDDDIRDISPADLQDTVSMLGPYSATGMRVSNFPDNSVACHAHRMTGGLQDVFITGAALAVDCQKNTAFFPSIYNEDWLFFYDLAASRKLGSSERKVTQLRYNPFADAQRAAWQEFGDILAEGLYALLDRGQDWQDATDGYWLHFLDARWRFLEEIADRADTVRPDIREHLLRSVEMALKCSATIEPGLLERYVLHWRQDLRNWQQRKAMIGPMPSLDAALRALDLERSDDGQVTDVARRGSAVPTEEPPTTPFALRDLHDLMQRDGDHDSDPRSGRGKRGRRTKRAGTVSHHGAPGIRERGLFASARRGFRSTRGEDAQPQAGTSPEARTDGVDL
jgi:hypothetical protein